MSVFDEVAKLIKKQANVGEVTDAHMLLLAAKFRQHEIEDIRRNRYELKQKDTRRPDINMMTVVMEMHPLELEAIKLLCPALAVGNSKGKKEAWQWVLKQPWAEEFKPGPIEKRYF